MLWSESLTVELENGYFATPLGSDTNPISSEVVADGEVYVELAVDGGAPLPARH